MKTCNNSRPSLLHAPKRRNRPVENRAISTTFVELGGLDNL